MMTDASTRFLVEHCPIGLSQHRLSGEFIAASPACERLFGRSQKELLGRDLVSLVSSSDQDRVRSEWSQVCTTGSDRQVRFQYTHPEGTSRWVEVTLRAAPSPATDETPDTADRPTQQVICCARDVTAEQAAEQARAERLAAAELAERHRDYLVQMTPGLIWFGPVSPDLSSYRAIYMSDYLFRVTGYNAKQWLETKGFWQSIIHPDDREKVLREAPVAMREERALGPYRIRASDGRILWIQSHMALERDAAGVPVRMYGLTIDMTSFQQAQEERMALQQELAQQAQRLLALSTPLIPISSDVLVMPLIGSLDPARAQHAQETLLNGVSTLRARYVLIDLTGVSVIDAASTAALMKMTSAVRLLGSRVILTGMRAEIARALTQLDLELSQIVTRPSLRAAVAEFVTSTR